jgi:WD40 repeat protein
MSGDDDGEVKLWDLRTTEAVFEAKEQADTITGLRFDQTYTNIISSSQDGTIAIYDVKKGSTS